MKKNVNKQCMCEGILPEYKGGCKNIPTIKHIKIVRISKNGDCFDQNDNYLGKAKIKV